MNDATTKPGLESEICSRCCGTGRYSWCSAHGSVCFKCAGKGKTLTKKGAAALTYLNSLRSKQVKDLVPGDVIFFAGAGPIPSAWAVFERLMPCDNSGTLVSINGVMQPIRNDLLSIECGKYRAHGFAPEDVIRIRQTKEQAAETMAKALAYQDTLTKAGTVRKGKK